MEQREKLIELLTNPNKTAECLGGWCSNECKYFDSDYCKTEMVADYLIANGVVVLPCRCGECEYHTLEEPGMVYCPHLVGGWVSNGDFCSGAKRKGGDE